MTSSRPPHAHRFSSSPSPSQHPYLSSTPPTSTSHTSTPQPPTTAAPHSSTPQPQSTPQTLTPFFTLISDPNNTTHKHPVVHYTFSDDDFDPIPSSANGRGQGQEQERVVVVDMNADGESVAAAHSLSSDWQVVGSNVASAPQWMAGDEDGGSAGASGSGGGLMLTIRGLNVPKVGSMGAAIASGATGAGGGGKETLYELAEMYHERMAEIKNVIEYAEKSAGASTSAKPEP